MLVIGDGTDAPNVLALVVGIKASEVLVIGVDGEKGLFVVRKR